MNIIPMNPLPPEVTAAMELFGARFPLSGPVAIMEKRLADCHALVSTIIVTLRINRSRDTLTSADNVQFDAMIEAWAAEADRLAV